MKRVLVVVSALVAAALGFAAPASAAAATAVPASANVWYSTDQWYVSHGACAQAGKIIVSQGAKAYACDYDASHGRYPWELRILD
jgi:hypothetical protein